MNTGTDLEMRNEEKKKKKACTRPEANSCNNT